MTCIVAYRVHRGPVEVVRNELDSEIAEFGNADEAQAYVDSNRLFQSGQVMTQIIELDEL